MPLKNKKPIAITLGEPQGIGVDIVVKLIHAQKFNYPYLIIGDPDLLYARAKKLKLNIHLPVKNIYPISVGKKYVLECLNYAVKLCLEKKCAALITGPVNKAIVNHHAGVKFSGHTQYLAKLTRARHPVMFFISPHFKLALVTDHVPLKHVSQLITPTRLKAVINQLLLLKYKKIAVCGLNPHAGEEGVLGDEEIKVIKPVLEYYRKKYRAENNIIISGPHSADSLFNQKNVGNYDVIVAMYHDQGLTVLKHRDFGRAVNVTLGLPFLRTSVDHGTAIELAGTGKADAENLQIVFEKTAKWIEQGFLC